MRIRWGLFPVLFLCLLGAGCVQAKPNEKPLEAARLMVTRGANGVNMQWNSELGRVYTLYFRETRGADTAWKPVPGYEKIQGTGEMIEYRDTSPTAMNRRYRLHTVMPAPGSN